MFRKLTLSEWRQLRNVDIDFHPSLTVLTGANGAGKTTILNLLNQHFGWSAIFLSTPVNRKTARRHYAGQLSFEIPSPVPQIGTLVYADGAEAALVVPMKEQQHQYAVSIQGQQPVPGIFLPSHRPVYTYQRVDNIPTTIDAREQLLDQYLANLRSFWAANARVVSPSLRLKQSLISLATFGPGNESVEPNREALDTFEGFQGVLRQVLPESLGFSRISIRLPEVVLECRTGDFTLDAASGGISALIDVSWQIYLRSMVSPEFVVVADELENHLHPGMQRTLLPGLIRAFPQAQFVVATHNPFVVGSVPDSNVYVLDFIDAEDGARRVESQLLDLQDKSGSADDVLRTVLGVPMPTPLWVEEALQDVARLLDRPDLDVAVFEEVRARLREQGLQRYLPSLLDPQR